MVNERSYDSPLGIFLPANGQGSCSELAYDLFK